MKTILIVGGEIDAELGFFQFGQIYLVFKGGKLSFLP